MNERLNESLRRLMDGELRATEVRHVLREAAEDEEALALLNLEFRVRSAFGREQEAAWVPEDFADRVMRQVQLRSRGSEHEAALGTRFGSWLERLLEALVTPRPVVLRPALALGTILVLGLAAVLILSRQQSSIPAGAQSAEPFPAQQVSADEQVIVPFVYVNADAQSVGVAGDFNDWEPTDLQRKVLNGRVVWTTHLPVSRGEHRYMFVINGDRWESDPLAPAHEDDGFGNTNAILAL